MNELVLENTTNFLLIKLLLLRQNSESSPPGQPPSEQPELQQRHRCLTKPSNNPSGRSAPLGSEPTSAEIPNADGERSAFPEEAEEGETAPGEGGNGERSGGVVLERRRREE